MKSNYTKTTLVYIIASNEYGDILILIEHNTYSIIIFCHKSPILFPVKIDHSIYMIEWMGTYMQCFPQKVYHGTPYSSILTLYICCFTGLIEHF